MISHSQERRVSDTKSPRKSNKSKSPRTLIKRSSTTEKVSQRRKNKTFVSMPSIPDLDYVPTKISVSITNMQVTGLVKRDLMSKPDTYLEIHFGNHVEKTTISRNELDPQWDTNLNFVYSPQNLNEERLTIFVWDVQRFNEVCMGYVDMDLFTVVTGPKEHDFNLHKKKKKKPISNSDEFTRGRLKFLVEVTCKSMITISLLDISCERLKPAETQKQFPSWMNDPFMEYFLESIPEITNRTHICYNTLAPTWMECKPLTFTGTWKDILSQVIVINIYHFNYNEHELLGGCKVPISKYYSFKGTPIQFSETLTYHQFPFGEIKASLLLKGLPPYAQMEGGCHNEFGIVGNAKPLLKELPHCNSSETFKLELDDPVFPPAKSKQRKVAISSKPKADSYQLEANVKELLKKLKSCNSDESVHIVKNLGNLAEKDVERASKIFRVDGVIVTFIKILKRSPGLSLRKEICRSLWITSKSNSKNLEVIRLNGGISILLKQLQTEDEKLFQYSSGILLPLSIRDSGIQELFQKEETIHFLVDMLRKSKKGIVTEQIVKILGNLSYGIAAGEPNNRDVIRLCGGIKELVNVLNTGTEELRPDIITTLHLLVILNHENRKEIVTRLFSILDSKNVKWAILYLQTIDSFLSMKTNNQNEDEEIKKMFLDIAALSLMRYQAISEEKELVTLAQLLLRKYSYAGSEEKLITELIQELWSPDESTKHMAIETMATWIKRSPGACNPLEEAVKTKNAFVPLISIIHKSFSKEDKNLTSPLQLLKKLTSDMEISKLLLEIGGTDFVQLLIKLIDHPDIKVQKNSIQIITNLSRLDKKADVICSKTLLLERVLQLSTQSPNVALKTHCLKLIYSLLFNAEYSHKNYFKDLGGVQELNKLILQGPSLAEYAIKIIHAICFPTVAELRDVVQCVIKEKVIDNFCTQLTNPLLIKPPDVHSIIPTILGALKDFSSDEDIRSSLKEDSVVSVVGQLTSAYPIDTIGQEARNCIKAWGYGSLCTCVANGSTPVTQQFAECVDCGLTEEEGICSSCVDTCHRGHQVRVHGNKASFFCRCGASNFCNALKLTKDPKPVMACTFIYSGRKAKMQDAFQCKNCFSIPDKYICAHCSKSTCHKGHLVVFVGLLNFSCCCGDRMKGCRLREPGGDSSGTMDGSLQEPQNSSNTSQSSNPSHTHNDDDDDDDSTCIVCFEQKKDTVFYKCGHLACCNQCATVMRDKRAECPICRAPILDVTKVYQV